MLFNLRFSLRSLRTRPTRMLLSTFGIVLGVATILAISITNQTALQSVKRLFSDTAGKANLEIVNAGSDSSLLSEKILRQVQENPQVSSAVPSIHINTLLADQVTTPEIGLSFFGSEVGGLTIYGIDPTLDPDVREYTLVEGRFLAQDPNSSEVVLVENFAEDNDIQVGKSIEIVTENSLEKLEVVGLIAKEGPGQLNNGAFGVMQLVTAQKYFFRDDELDQIDILVSTAYQEKSNLDQLKSTIQQQIGQDFSVIYPASQGERMTQMLESYQIGLNFLSGTALFVGIFLIYNAFSMTVVERTREFGMLRTIGMTRAQVTRQVLVEAALLGIVGSVFGLILGIFLARGLSRLMELMINQELTGIQVPQDAILTGILVGLFAAILAAAIPAFQAGRISPLEALRIRGNIKEGWLVRRGWIIGILLLVLSTIILVLNPFPYDVQFRMGSIVVFSLFIGGTLIIPGSVSIWERILRPLIQLLYRSSGRIGSSNIQRAKLRTTLTVAALMIGVAMIMIVWVMTGSFKGDLDQWLEGYIGGDLYVTSSLPIGRDVWKKLEAVPGVAGATPVRYFDINWQPNPSVDESLVYMAVDPYTYNQVTSFVFSDYLADEGSALRDLAAGDSVFISSVLAEKYDLQPGDEINLTTKTGPRGFNIAAIVVDYYNQGMVINGSWGDMNRYFRLKDANAFLVKVQEGSDAQTVQNLIEDRYGKIERLVVASNQSLLSRVTRLLNQAFGMFDVLALIALFVGFLGIMNTLTMNIMERTQEIGMLRSVGMTRSQVIFMVLAESAQIGLIGGIFGVAFGLILARIFMLAMTAMSGYKLDFILPPDRILIALVIALVVSQVAALLPAIRAARLGILEAIHYE
ncbi:MAG: ABC transporter permease [Anaerolineales bacterium]|jgi:putative ABC transport system permease protein